MAPRDRYLGFADLAKHEVESVDYRITVVRRSSSDIAVIAPHGGKIEPRTTEIACAIAGNEFNLYLFEGIKGSRNFATLHLTSRCFDEPSCLALLEECSSVLAIHGLGGDDERVMVGGLDASLKAQIAQSLRQAEIRAETDAHAFHATDPDNICNRGRSGKGIQLELSRGLRGSAIEARFIRAVRAVLLSPGPAG